MDYQSALDYLYSFIDHERKAVQGSHAAAFNLPRMAALLADLGNPHVGLRHIHVAGTKGKGSTCAYIESILRHAGYRVGLFSSPHLHSWRERVQIDRQLITRTQVAAWVTHVQPVVAAFDVQRYGRPTTFELTTALALLEFQARNVDAAVIEVGLGGRYDSTNVIMPQLAAITNISRDHTRVLGDTIAEIAYDKAGIIKPGIPVLSGPQRPEAGEVIRRVAAEQGAPLYSADVHGLALLAGPGHAPGGTATALHIPAPALQGAIQRENARVAAGAALLLRQAGWHIPDEAIDAGIRLAWWPGRIELVPGAPRILLDGAHNDYSAQRLVQAWEHELGIRRPVLVLGLSRDKDMPGIVQALVPHAAAVVLTASRHPRALRDLDEIRAVAEPLLAGPLLTTEDVPEALTAARALAGPDGTVVVTGSLFVVAAAREQLALPGSDEAD